MKGLKEVVNSHWIKYIFVSCNACEDSGLKNFKQKKIINEIKIESRKKQRKRVRNSIKKHKIIQYTIHPIKEKKIKWNKRN